MAVDMFLKLEGVKGESQDSKHSEEIDVLAWSWGMSQSGSMHVGGGGGAGKVSIQDLSITKYIDKSSPVLMMYCSSGKQFKEGLLTVRKAGGDSPVEYLLIKMTEVIVTSYSTGGSGGQDLLTENISLNFAEVDVDYTPQKQDGTAEAAIKYGWDIAKNLKK
ncbi:MAG: type VI secretion system tube protein Hcp [Lamprocystis purpurea]|jgi:type VI secretion system secreted protein Hcp|uniref:Hcp family type VI secretion system effector n=1 Tax=Lamprocystis purpurea TaxID=61598 RepID=UPI000360E10A|nr:type VI secretion system tube protein Hcp [Lamprocystis purpurea]MBV5275297.1 type VI secretion system tube protein Hcp [Lamprocystis purpurea]